MLFRPGIFVFVVVIQYTTQISLSQQNNNVTVVIIDHSGNGSPECCTGHESCTCSNLSLALQHMNSNTEILINSTIPLYTLVELEKVISNVNIVGIDHPTIHCNNQSGLHSKNINSMVIQNIEWEKCELKLSFSENAEIINCRFQHSPGEFALTLDSTTAHVESSTFVENSNGLLIYSSNVTIYECNFIANSERTNCKKVNDQNVVVSPGHGIYCSWSNLALNFSYFINNTNSAVVLENSQFTMSGNVTFYNNGVSNSTDFTVNVMEPYKETCVYPQGGYNTMIRLADENGGAISLINSTTYFHRGVFIFNKNSAGNGGAIYIGRNSSIQFTADNSTNTKLEFFNNTAASLGGALYINIDTNIHDITYYYNILAGVTKHDSNIAYKGGSYAYFNVSSLIQCQSTMSEKAEHGNLFSSSVCTITNDFNNAAVKVNKSDYINGSVSFWLHDLKLDLVAKDYFGHLLNNIPFEGTLSCNNTQCRGNRSCDEQHKKVFNYTIENIDDNVILTLKNTGTIGCCCLSNYDSSVIILKTASSRIPVTVIWTIPKDQCSDDIGHYILNETCLPTSCDNLLQTASFKFPPGLACPNGYITAVPSYWYDNGFKSYISSCPSDNCNLNHWYTKILLEPFPDQSLQCNGNWGGFACGECNYSANYSIKYDTTECVPVKECLVHASVTYSLLILFAVSFFYWMVMISFIFVLLHFRFFNVKAGYGYGIIFYYSVLEHIVVVFNEIVQTENCGFSNDEHYYQCVSIQTKHNVLKRHLLPFLSTIGILKPPFMQYMRLCLHKFERIDHIFLLYIHPFTVMLIVTVLFISYRNCAIVARAVGRFINSATICLLILLSYSSVSHTSLQLLRPLPHFEFSGANGTKYKGLRLHWSPTNSYFSGRHKYYFIVAILCELIIGIGLPIFLLMQRCLTRYFNFNQIKLIIDQLQGCYRNNCYWFAAYYLICRQIIYCVDVFIVFETNLWNDHISVKLVTLLIICIFILAIHLWFQPYHTSEELETRNLNLLDSAILSTLVMLLVCSLDGRSYGVTVIFWILPLIYLFNYLTYSTKLKHIFALTSICVVIALASILVFIPPTRLFYYMNYVSILCLLTSFCTLMTYLIAMIKLACTKYWHRKDQLESAPQIIDYSIESDHGSDK